MICLNGPASRLAQRGYNHNNFLRIFSKDESKSFIPKVVFVDEKIEYGIKGGEIHGRKGYNFTKTAGPQILQVFDWAVSISESENRYFLKSQIHKICFGSFNFPPKVYKSAAIIVSAKTKKLVFIICVPRKNV